MPVDHTKKIIEVDHVSFAYDRGLVLKDVTFAIHPGDYLGIIGPNGGGKTTLLKVMLGLLRPSAGEVRLFAHPVGYVPQKATAFDPLFPASVFDVVAMGRYGKRGLFHRLNDNDRAKIHEALRHVDMLEYRDRLVGDLSGGQQQRVFIARALAGEPEVIFLDEPTVGVDIEAQEQFYLLLRRLNREIGLTLVLISHDIDVVASEATELACINQSLIYHGAPKAFLADGGIEKLYGKHLRQIVHGH